MKLITLALAVLMLALSIVAVPQSPSNDVFVIAPDMEGPIVADAQRPRHCQSCTRYVDKCIKNHPGMSRRECEKELCRDMPKTCQNCQDWGIDCPK